MSEHSDDRELLTRYFLGVASTAECEVVEERYFAVDSTLEVLLQAEDEVIDDYVRGTLTRSEQVLFEKNFLCTAARRQRLEFTKSLREALAGAESGELFTSDQMAPDRFSVVTGRPQEEAKTEAFFGIPHGQLALDDRQELFSSLLGWLDPVRERAAEKYETIRSRLIRMFASRGIVDAEELADETIDRVSLRFTELKQTYVGDPVRYFYAEARSVLLESQRARAPILPEAVSQNIEAASLNEERAHSCLQKCLEQLSDSNRELILQFYSLEKKDKIGDRKELAQRLGIPLNTLRRRAHRIRTSLQKCVTSCLKEANDLL